MLIISMIPEEDESENSGSAWALFRAIIPNHIFSFDGASDGAMD